MHSKRCLGHFLWAITMCTSVFSVNAYDLYFDKEHDTRNWNLEGPFFYTAHMKSVEGLLPGLLSSVKLSKADGAPKQSGPGVWFTKHIPGEDNKWKLSYRLQHHLFEQVWVKFLASPTNPVIISTNNVGKGIVKFWSNGKSWCDAVLNLGQENTVTVEFDSPNENDFAILDKIVVGSMGNITAFKTGSTIKFRPCFTKQPEGEQLQESGTDYDTLPDMQPPEFITPVQPSTVPTTGRPQVLTAMDTLTQTKNENGTQNQCQCSCTCSKS